MKIVNHGLPTEGVRVGGVLFRPGEEAEVEDGLAKELIKRKGFVRVDEARNAKRDKEE